MIHFRIRRLRETAQQEKDKEEAAGIKKCMPSEDLI